LSRAFGGSFDFGKFLGSQPRGGGLGAEPGLRLFAKWQTGLWIGLNAANTHWGNRLVAHAASCSAAVKRRNAGLQKVLVLQCVYVIDARSNLSQNNVIAPDREHFH
jgi:hypothetical protein